MPPRQRNLPKRMHTSSALAELEELIDHTKRNEDKCRKHLKHARTLLFREDVLRKVLYEEADVPSSAGEPDYVISGLVSNPTGRRCCRAYVWELKAPQCFIFKKVTENRLCPSDDLVSAENQLLHYVDEIKKNKNLQERFQVLSEDDIRFGGIIIGSRKKLVSGDLERPKAEALYDAAQRIREEYFYRPAGIKLCNWNDVLDHLRGMYTDIRKSSSEPNHKFKTDRLEKAADFKSFRGLPK